MRQGSNLQQRICLFFAVLLANTACGQNTHLLAARLDESVFQYHGDPQTQATAISIRDSLPETRAPLPEALDNLVSNDAVEVFPTCLDQDCLNQLIAEQRGILFRPRHIAPDRGVVFYPGGRVDPRAYAPIAQKLAQAGVVVILTPMPDNLATLGFDRFRDVIADVPEVDRWYLSGHSLGGVMAVRYAIENPTDLTGLILWGSYVTESIDLSQIDLPVTSIYGLQDGVVTPEEIETGKSFLPSDTLYVPLLGANHAQFGHYGEQEGDQAASISHELQQQLTVSATLYAMNAAEREGGIHPGFVAAADLEKNWCAIAQQQIAHLENHSNLDITVERFDNLEAYATSKPGFPDAQSSHRIATRAYFYPSGNAENLAVPPVYVSEVWCKLKSQAAILEQFQTQAAGSPKQCAAVNRLAVDWALDQLSERQRSRYEDSGKSIALGDDLLQTRGDEWLYRSTPVLSQSRVDNAYILSSPSLVTNLDADIPDRLKGMHYCKLWSPARALHWVLADEASGMSEFLSLDLSLRGLAKKEIA